ncbi:MAG: DUF4143 domain-containing protein [Coriobacteriales bacterium]|nr:DUF4143 domain-containing protein [Coriobacteriales bacterium]
MSTVDVVSRNQAKIRALLRSLARNTASLVTNKTLADGTAISAEQDEVLAQRTIVSYLNSLKRLYVLDEIPAWSPEMRAKIRLRVTPKRQLVDPSLAAAAMNADNEMLMRDLKTLGLLFEVLCLRDLLVYAQANDSVVNHYLDSTGLDVDAVIESPGGGWAAFEIRLGDAQVDEAARKLVRLREKIVGVGNRPPLCLGVIVGVGAVSHRRDDGIFVIPIDLLGA